MSRRFNLAKSMMLALGIGASLALSTASKAALPAPVNFAYVGGGSSALQGSFAAPPSFSLGAIPYLIIQDPGSVAGFATAGATVNVLQASNVVLHDNLTFQETVGTALVLYVVNGNAANGGTEICILLRSDSGQGVRYVANSERIINWGGTFNQVTGAPAGPFAFNAVTANTADAPGNPVGSLINFLITQSGSTVNGGTGLSNGGGTYATSNEHVDNGLADVSADTVISFGTGSANGGVIPATGSGSIQKAGIAGASSNALPVQTLLLLYNSNETTAHPINFTRTQFRSLIYAMPGDSAEDEPLTWKEIDPTAAPGNATLACWREQSSGTRMTELLDIQRFSYGTPANPSANTLLEGQDPVAAATWTAANPQQGTGAMLGTLNATADSVGYAFVNGGNENNKGNIRVGLCDGVAPYAAAGAGPISLPNNNGQAAYNVGSGNTLSPPSTYYLPVALGQYELWSKAKEYTAAGSGQATMANSIASLLQGPTPADVAILHGLGLTALGEMQVTRSGFPGTVVAADTVDDGDFITYDFNYNPNIFSSAIIQ